MSDVTKLPVNNAHVHNLKGYTGENPKGSGSFYVLLEGFSSQAAANDFIRDVHSLCILTNFIPKG